VLSFPEETSHSPSNCSYSHIHTNSPISHTPQKFLALKEKLQCEKESRICGGAEFRLDTLQKMPFRRTEMPLSSKEVATQDLSWKQTFASQKPNLSLHLKLSPLKLSCDERFTPEIASTP